MKIKIGYQGPFTQWSITHVFKKYHDYCLENFKDIEIEYLNYDHFLDNNPSGLFSPHNMRIINEESGKYIVVSYWDKAEEMTWEGNGWDHKNCVMFVTSSGVHTDMEFTPFSYLPYNIHYDNLSLNAKRMEEKENCELVFRGFLYGDRLNMSERNVFKVTNEKIYPEQSYFEDLTNNKICLSLNGAGEICNRDLEILSSRSVLFRPLLKQKFHNELIPNVHYIGFELRRNVDEQIEVILDKFNEIKDNVELLKYVSENGYEWYQNNGTIESNFRLLTEIIDLNLLK
jgi:hypothetical protein